MATDKQIHVGWASTSITPDRPVQLYGQFHERISKSVRDPVTATVLALETRDAQGIGEQAILVSCDVAGIYKRVQEAVRAAVASQIPDFNVRKLFLAATHTHTAPPMDDSETAWHRAPSQGAMGGAEYVPFFVGRVSGAVVAAWRARKPGGVSWALGHAVIGHNRRMIYDNGLARMYGRTDTAHFMHQEGSEDSGVEMLFTWNEAGALTGMILNPACPSQVVEGKDYASADYWSEARNELRKRYGDGLYVLPLCGAGGDQSPRDLVRRDRGEANMRDDAGLFLIAGRIANAVDEVYPQAHAGVHTTLLLKHVVRELALPIRMVTTAEVEEVVKARDELLKKGPIDPTSGDAGHLDYYRILLARHAAQSQKPTRGMELHVLRIGDVALATNPFELFLDYGQRIKARSVAQQTFVAQLACDVAGYLPTARAVAGGGYGAWALDNEVGPEGGQVLVDETVRTINAAWASAEGAA